MKEATLPASEAEAANFDSERSLEVIGDAAASVEDKAEAVGALQNQVRKYCLDLEDTDRLNRFNSLHQDLLKPDANLNSQQAERLISFINGSDGWESNEEGATTVSVVPVAPAATPAEPSGGRMPNRSRVIAPAAQPVEKSESTKNDNTIGNTEVENLRNSLQAFPDGKITSEFVQSLDISKKRSLLVNQINSVKRNIESKNQDIQKKLNEGRLSRANADKIKIEYDRLIAHIDQQLFNVKTSVTALNKLKTPDNTQQKALYEGDLLVAYNNLQQEVNNFVALVETDEEPVKYTEMLVSQVSAGRVICDKPEEIPQLIRAFSTDKGKDDLSGTKQALRDALYDRWDEIRRQSDRTPADSLRLTKLRALIQEIDSLAIFQRIPHRRQNFDIKTAITKLHSVFNAASVELRNIKYPDTKGEYETYRKEYVAARVAWFGQSADENTYGIKPRTRGNGTVVQNRAGAIQYEKNHKPNQVEVRGIKDTFEEARITYEKALLSNKKAKKPSGYDDLEKQYVEARQRYYSALEQVLASRRQNTRLANRPDNWDKYDFREKKEGGPRERSRLKLAALNELTIEPGRKLARSLEEERTRLRNRGDIKLDVDYYNSFKKWTKERWPLLVGGKLALVGTLILAGVAPQVILMTMAGGLVGQWVGAHALRGFTNNSIKKLANLIAKNEQGNYAQRASQTAERQKYTQKMLGRSKKVTLDELASEGMVLAKKAERMKRTAERRDMYGRIIGGMAGASVGGMIGNTDLSFIGQAHADEAVAVTNDAADISSSSEVTTTVVDADESLTTDSGPSPADVSSEVFQSNPVTAEKGDSLIKMMRTEYGEEMFEGLSPEQQQLAESRWRIALNADSNLLNSMHIESGNADEIVTGKSYDLGPGASKLLEIVRDITSSVEPGSYSSDTGVYGVAGDDNFWDMAEGQTDAPKPQTIELMQEHNGAYVQALIDETVKSLNKGGVEMLRDYGFQGNTVDELWPGDQINWDKVDGLMKEISMENEWLTSEQFPPENNISLETVQLLGKAYGFDLISQDQVDLLQTDIEATGLSLEETLAREQFFNFFDSSSGNELFRDSWIRQQLDLPVDEFLVNLEEYRNTLDPRDGNPENLANLLSTYSSELTDTAGQIFNRLFAADTSPFSATEVTPWDDSHERLSMKFRSPGGSEVELWFFKNI